MFVIHHSLSYTYIATQNSNYLTITYVQKVLDAQLF